MKKKQLYEVIGRLQVQLDRNKMNFFYPEQLREERTDLTCDCCSQPNSLESMWFQDVPRVSIDERKHAAAFCNRCYEIIRAVLDISE
jgi:hypothetical protein